MKIPSDLIDNVCDKVRLRLLTLAATIACLAALLPSPAQAQHGFDAFGAMRTLQVGYPTNLVGSGFTAGVTNGPVDIRLFAGTVKLDLFSNTNTPTTGNAVLETSPDSTNWYALTNFATASVYAVTYTNTFYGTTNLTVTDTWLLPGTVTTPTAATAGFATPYLTSAPFTNQSSAVAATTRNWYSIGFNAEDSLRYFHIIWLPTGGTATNWTVGATLTGKANYVP